MCGVPDELSDFQPAPNQAGRPDLYEIENQAIDPDGRVLEGMRKLAPWAGRTLVDLGCGSGYWLTGYASEAARVIGVEPDRELVRLAVERGTCAEVVRGSAEHIPLPDASADVVHARFAYFWPPNCAAGLADFEEVLRLEFPRQVAESWLAAHPGATGLSYGYVLITTRKAD